MKQKRIPPQYVTSLTHAGMSGKNNEDRHQVIRFSYGKKRLPALCAVVADGIGGHRAGEIAAELAIEHLIENICTNQNSAPVDALKNAMLRTNEAILEASYTNAQWAGMGSTCACALVVEDRLYIATAGDSRIYLLRNGRIHQLNRDHTWVQEAVDHGLLTPEEARSHPHAHIIRRYLGSPHGLLPDTRLFLDHQESDAEAESNQGVRLMPGDQLLLCSDGLTDLVNDGEILLVLQKKPLEYGLQELVKLANQRGGHDNITIVGLQMPGKQVSNRQGVWKLAAVGVLTAAILGVIGLYALRDQWDRLNPQPTVSAPLTSPFLQASVLPMQSPQVIFTETAASPATATPLFPNTQTAQARLPTATFTPWPTNTPAPP